MRYIRFNYPDETVARETARELATFLKLHARQMEVLAPNPMERSHKITKAQEAMDRKYPVLPWGKFNLDWQHDLSMIFQENIPVIYLNENAIILEHDSRDILLRLGNYLKVRGGVQIGSLFDDFFVTLLLKWPDGEPGRRLRKELSEYFADAGQNPLEVESRPEWARTPDGEPGERNPVAKSLQFTDPVTGIFLWRTDPQNLPALKEYLKSHSVEEYHIRLCDIDYVQKVEKLNWMDSCPQCGGQEYAYLATEFEGLGEDQYLCSVCGGMFELETMGNLFSRIRIASGVLESIRGKGKSFYFKVNSTQIYRLRAAEQSEHIYTAAFGLLDVYPLDEKRILGCGSGPKDLGLVILSQDGGNSWIKKKIPGAGRLEGIAVSPEQNIFLAGSGGLYCSRDQGQSWSKVKSDLAGFRVVFPLSEEKWLVVAAVAYGGIWKSEDAGSFWSVCHYEPGCTWNRFVFFDEWVGLAYLRYVENTDIEQNPLLRTVDGGETWRNVESFEQVQIVDCARGTGNTAYLLSRLENETDEIDMKLHISRDGGETWSQGELPEGIIPESLWFAPDGILYLGGEDGVLSGIPAP